MYSGLEFCKYTKLKKLLFEIETTKIENAIIKDHFPLENESCNYQTTKG